MLTDGMPTDRPRGVGSWRYIFHTRERGDVDLDTLLAQIDSVLSGKRRGGGR